MGVYIRGMEMPTTGLYIVGIDNANGRDKTVVTVERMLCIRDIRQIVGSFELISVPSHGRLIDADALIAAHEQVCSRSMKFNLDLAPTIIPAEPCNDLAKPNNAPNTLKALTNADSIRSMTDEELAKWFVNLEVKILNIQPMLERPALEKDWLEWLQKECE